MVKFCPQCNNIFSHKVDEKTHQLCYICPTCGNTDKVIDRCIVINDLNTRVQDYPLNSNMIYDRTLKRTRKIPCPNDECQSNKADTLGNPEICIFQYNPTFLNTGYICTECQTFWKN
jgi:DNA-directed RNA polymerase subunit M/transcription elongation factor TFIIS